MGKDKEKLTAIEVRDKVKKDVEKYYRTRSKLWRDEEELYFGKVWKNTNDYRPYENNVFDIIESAVAILTDNLPAPSVSVNNPEKSAQAKNLEKAIGWVNEDQNLPLKLPEVVRKSLVTGNGWLHPYYDYEAENGEGREIYEILDYCQVKLSGRTDNIEDCDKAHITLNRSRDWLKLRYPNKTKEIEKAKAPEPKDQDSERGKEESDYGSGYSIRTPHARYQDDDTLELEITYVRDYTLEKPPVEEILEDLAKEAQSISEGRVPDLNKWEPHEEHIAEHEQELEALLIPFSIPVNTPFEEIFAAFEELIEQNPDAGEEFAAQLQKIKALIDHIEDHKNNMKLNPSGMRLKYKGGYRVIETVNNTVLYDGPNKNWHGEIPLVPFYCHRNGTIYADGMIRNIADSQRMQAVLGYKEYKGLQKVSNPEKEVNLASGLTKDDITNEDGAIYEVKEGEAWSVRNLQVGQVSEQGVRFQNERIDKMRQISGMTDPTRGELPDGRLSEVTVMKTQNQALGRLRLSDRQNQYYSLRRLSKLVASDILQHWTTEKVVGVEHVDGEAQEILFNPLEMQDLEYDIKPTAGTMSGIDKDAFNAFVTSLMNQNKITFKQWSEIAEVPKVEKLREFAGENDEIQMQAQQLQEQLQQMQIENIKLKAGVSPELLSPEEVQLLDQVTREESLQRITGVTEDQPEQ